MLALIGGFVMRYLPNVFSWVMDYFKEKREAREQQGLVKLEMQRDELRAKLANEGKRVDAEIQEQLAVIQAQIEEMRASMEDRKSARQYGQRALSLAVETLKVGTQLGLPRWVLSIGWFLVMGVECLAASVQPMLAVCVVAMWMFWKFNAPTLLWTTEDWWLMESIVGFFLAGRTQKWAENKRWSTSVVSN